MSKKLLIITYYWPPSGGAGVQRWVKFARYLPDHGWEPLILTVDPSCAAYPVTDDSLVSEVASTQVFTTPARNFFLIYNKDKSKIPSAGFAKNSDSSLRGKLMRFIRGNFFIPDPRRGWNKYAFEKASELIVSNDIINVITTSPPHSTQLIGLQLKKRFPDINWIADLRDPWTDIYYYDQFYPTFISRKIDKKYEKEVLRKADSIITVGNALKELFTLKVPEAEKKIKVITNGYDPEDFTGKNPETPEIFTITYVGTLSDIYPIDGLLDALTIFRSKGYKFLLSFIGMVSRKQKELLESRLNPAELQFHPYTDHSGSINYMLRSSALLLIIPDHGSNKSIITGKIFEYIAAGKRMICLGPPDGDASSILNETGNPIALHYNDVDGIFENLISTYSNHKSQVINNITPFSRSELAGSLSKLLNESL